MANKVLLKKSSVASKVPLTTDLSYGELALNYTDEKLYFKNAANAIKSFNVTPSSLTIGTGLSGTSYNGSSAITIAIDSTVSTLTGIQTLTNKTLTSPTINTGTISGGTLNNCIIGGTTPADITGSSVTSTGNLVSSYSSGDEGGEILLTKPQTNSSIGGAGVRIDVYQNKLRIWEDGGTNRGVYIDLTSATAGVGSNLLSSASSVTSVSVVSANGFAGTVATSTTTPAITLTTSITGLLKGNGTAISAATAGTDYASPSQTMFIGTTSVAINRASANLALTGISSITLPGSTSGTVQLVTTAIAGTGTILTIPAVTGTIVTTGDSATVTNTMLAGSIAITKLVSSTISGVSLGNSLNALTIGSGLSGTSYNGSTGVTIAIDSTVATLTGIQTLTNKTLTSPAVTTSLTTGSTTFNLLNTTATTINIGGASTTISIGNTAHTGTTSIQHDLYVYGNITFGGGSTQLSATQLVIDDPLIYIGSNNTADIIDLGIVGAYNNGTHLHTGLVRDASDSVWKLFSGMTSEPSSSTVDFTGVTYAPLQVGSLTSTIATGTAPLTVTSTTLVSNLNSDYLDGQHGSYYTTAGNLTGTISSTVLGNSTHYIGTTAVTLNRASANLALTGISSVTLPGSTSGTVQLVPTAAVGTGTVLTIPAVTGTIVTTGDTGTVTNTMLAGSIAITKLASSTISGISLGNNLNALTISAPLSGTSYNGSSAISIGLSAAYGDTTNPYASKTANYFLAAPNGAAGVPTFRAVVAADIPTLNQNTTGAAAFLRQTDGTVIATPVQAITTTGSRSVDLAPNTYAYGLFSEFKGSSAFGSTGNYSGLITYANWQGTTASTGDPSYSLLFSPAAANSTAAPVLKIRAGIDTTWGSWSTILHSSNYNSYSPTLTGTGASGTWGISVTGSSASCTGNAATVTNGVYTTTAQTLTNKSLSDSTTYFIDETDATKKLQFQLSSITTATTRTLTVPDVNGTIITTGDTGTVTSTMIAEGTIVNGDISASAAIAITKLASSTISGVSLGSNLNALTISSPLVGTSYNGSTAVTLSIPAATTSVSGYLTSTDWNTFNGKQPAGSYLTASTGVTTFGGGTTGLTPAAATSGAITLAGTLAIANGGTNSTATPTLGGVGYGTGSAHAYTTVGTAGQVLQSNAAAAPSWTTLTLESLPDAWVKKSCACATTAALTINTAQVTIDGVTLTATSRVLVKDQAAPAQNGIYTGLTTTTWVRAADADTISELAGAAVNVDGGTVNGGKVFDTDLKSTDTLGTTAVNFYSFLDSSALSSTTPATIGTAAVGTGTTLARSDHVHAMGNLTGDVTSVGLATTLTNAPVIAKVLTGYVSGAGTVSATDSILGAIQKLNGNTPIASSTTPAALGTAAVGTGTTFARADHVHQAPTTITGNAATATTATNVAGGVAGSVHYQTAAATTAMTAASTAAGQVLTTVTAGGAPTWVSPVAAGSSGLFNPNMSASVGYLVTTSSAAVFTAPATAGLRYIVHSIHVTNIGTVAANLTSNITGTTYSGGIDLSCTLPIPIGGAVELLKKPKVMQPSDILNMISSVTSTLHATIAYEIASSTTYFGVGVNVTTDATYTDLYTMTGNSVLESIFLVNDSIDSDAKVTLVWTDGANTILGYFAYNFIVALNSTVELLEKPKYMASGYKLRIQSNVGNRVEAIVAGKTL